ncbi:fibronectin type III domain-containing protein, partial [Paenibacillus sp.]|uniref:fibronectin type III domain-containing protein n=1 Tax=Paenibacillus sp. TaxID=58172 RepID=UPI002D6D58C8
MRKARTRFRPYKRVISWLLAVILTGLQCFTPPAQVKAESAGIANFTVEANEANNGLVLSWTNPNDPNYSKVKIYRQIGTNTGSWSFVKEGNLTTHTDSFNTMKLYTTYYYKLEAYNKSNQMIGEPAYASGRLRAGPITLVSWDLENNEVVHAGNQHYYELLVQFLAEEDIVSIAYEYSTDGTNWAPFAELVPTAVARTTSGQWYRSVRVDMNDIPDGTHYIRAIATDASGDTLTEQTTFFKDSTRPNGVTNAAADVSQADTHVLTWVNPTADFHHVVIQRRTPGDSNTWTNVTTDLQNNTITVPAIAGLKYEYSITAVDAVGNKSLAVPTLQVQSPMDGPVIDVMEPADNTKTADASIKYNVKARDNVPVTSILVEVSTNGADWVPINASSTAPTVANHYYSVTGNHKLDSYGEVQLRFRATVTDQLGRTTSMERTVTVDRVAPQAPENLTATQEGGGVRLKWDALPDIKHYYIVRVGDSLNGVPSHGWYVYPPEVGVLDANAPKKPLTYTVSAVDHLNNQGPPATVSIVNTDGPALTLERGMEAKVNQSSYELRGTTEPGAQVKVNNVGAIVAADGSFRHTVSLQPGAQTLTVTSTDAGGTTTMVQRVVLDQQGPNLTAFEPADNTVVSGYSSSLRVAATDPGISGIEKIEFQVSLTDGNTWRTFALLDKSQFTQSTSTTSSSVDKRYSWNTFEEIEGVGRLPDGPYKFRVLVYDGAGNVTDGLPIRVWVVDNSAYEAEVGTPADFRIENRIEEIKLSWVKNVDTHTKEYDVYRSTNPAEGFAKIGSSATDTFVDKTVFHGTKYYYKVQAVSKVGVLGEFTPVLEGEALPDTIAPIITQVYTGTGNVVGGSNPSFRLSVQENSRLGVASVTAAYSTNNGEHWNALPGSVTGPHSASPNPYWMVYWDKTNFVSGPYLIRFTVKDKNGNSTVTTLDFTLDVDVETPIMTSLTSVDSMVKVEWAPIQAADYGKVEVLRSTRRDGSYHSSGSVTSAATTSFTDSSGLTIGQLYYYKLRFTDKLGNTSESAISAVRVADDQQPPTIQWNSPADGATIGGSSVQLHTSLSDNRGVSGTKAEYSTDGGTEWHFAANGSWSHSGYYYAWNLEGLQEGTYLVRISAWDAANNIATAQRSYKLDKSVSVAPNFKATPEENGILLTWDKISDPDQANHPYRIHYGTNPGGPYTEVMLAQNVSQYRIQNLHPTTTYYFKLKTVDLVGNVAWTPEISAAYLPDAAPPIIESVTPQTGVTIGGTGNETVRAYFKDNTGYVGATATFEYSVDGETWVPMSGTVSGPSVGYGDPSFSIGWVHKDLPSGTYNVRITIRDAAGNSASRTVVYALDHDAPAAPQNLIGRYGSGVVNLTWEKPADLDLKIYKLYRATSAAGPFTMIKEINSTALTYTDNTIQPGLTYYYKLRATDKFDQEGPESNVAAAYAVMDTEPPVVQNIAPANGTMLSPKTNVSVTATDNLTVSSIKLEYSVNGGETWATVGTKAASGASTGVSFTLESVMHHGELMIRAVATDSYGNQSTGGPVRTYTLDRQGPETVTGLVYVPGETTVYLEWSPVSDADLDYYVVEKRGSNEAEFTPISGSADAAPKRTVSGLERLKTYDFRVVGYDVRGNRGTPSDPVTVTTVSDGEAPVITELLPAQGSFDQQIALQAKARDNIGTAGFTFQYSRDRSAWIDIATLEGVSNSASYTWDTSALEEGTYYVRVFAWDGAGNVSDRTAAAKTVELRIDHTPPSVPTGLQASATAYSVVLVWDAPSDTDIAGMNVYRSESADGTYTLIKASQTGQRYDDESVDTGKTYYYKISAVDRAGLEGAATAPVQAQLVQDNDPPAITSLTPANGSVLGANPKLKASASDNYRLRDIAFEYRKQGGTAWTPLQTQTVTGRTALAEITWNTSSLTEGVYDVRVRATDATGVAGSWVEARYTLNMYAPAAPVLSAQAGGWQAMLTWTVNNEPDFKEYRVYRSLTPDSDFALKRTTSGTSFADTNVEPGVRYYYVVEAVDTYGNASRSNVVNVVPTDEDSKPPVAKIEYEGPTYLGRSIQFSGLKSTDNIRIERYEWDFGDGATSIVAEPVHAFQTAGAFTVKLTVYDPKGNQHSATVSIVVVDQPEKPAGLVGDPGDQKAYLSWTPNSESDIAGYHVYRLSGNDWVRQSGLLTESVYVAEGLVNGTEYSFSVTAVNTEGVESEKSQPIAVTPAVQTARTVAEAIANNSGAKQLVEGYIVGTTASSSAATPYDFTAPFSSPTTILLADDPLETRESHILVVHLSSGVSRAALNLIDYPENRGKKVWIRGDLQTYLQKPGMTNLTSHGFLADDAGDVEADRQALEIGYAVGDTAESVTQNLTLAVTGAKGSTISWASSAPTTVATNGQVTRPAAGSGDKQVTLTATIQKGAASATKTFVVVVKQMEATAPQAPTNLTAVASSAKVTLSWTASATPSVTYNVYRSETYGGGYSKLNAAPLTATTYEDTTVASGKTYYYVVKAVDGKGVESSASNEATVTVAAVPGVGRYEENYTGFVYEGRWLNHSNAGHSGGNVRYTESENASMTFTFRGTAVKIGSVLHPNHGIMDVYIDGTKAGSVDLYSSVSRNNQVVFGKTDLSDGVHTIKIVRTGIKNPAAMKATIAVDYVEVMGKRIPAPTGLNAMMNQG